MPYKPIHAGEHSGCPNLVPAGKLYWDKHAPLHCDEIVRLQRSAGMAAVKRSIPNCASAAHEVPGAGKIRQGCGSRSLSTTLWGLCCSWMSAAGRRCHDRKRSAEEKGLVCHCRKCWCSFMSVSIWNAWNDSFLSMNRRIISSESNHSPDGLCFLCVFLMLASGKDNKCIWFWSGSGTVAVLICTLK